MHYITVWYQCYRSFCFRLDERIFDGAIVKCIGVLSFYVKVKLSLFMRHGDVYGEKSYRSTHS